MKNILIIGNGTSRKLHEEFIDSWNDEIWACNQAYKEFGHKKNLTKIIGDAPTVPMILSWKEENKSSFEVVVTSRVYEILEPQDKPKVSALQCPIKYHNDSGTSLVAEALTSRYAGVSVAGFDLGGKDIYVEGHEKLVKAIWIDRWRKLAKDFSLDSIQFIGYDHKKFILSDLPADSYSKIYTRSGDHLKNSFLFDDDNSELKLQNELVLILGNGISRLRFKEKILSWEGEIWVCNWAFREASELPRIDRVGSVHQEVIKEAHQYKVENNLSYKLLTSNTSGIEDISEPFIDERGWSTGSLMIVQALKEGYSKIALSGFDMGGDDIYQPTPRPGGNFKKQFDKIAKENDMSGVVVLDEFGEIPIFRDGYLDSSIPPNELLRIPRIDLSSLKKKIIIMGNGNSILEDEFGSIVDQFQHVVRLNDFVTRGYEKHIGSKTTCWISGAGIQTKIKNRDTSEFEESILLLPKERFSLNPDGRTLNIEGVKASVEKNTEVPFENFFVIPPDQIDQIIEASKLERPSTGFCAILYYLHIRKEDRVVIHGFDSFQERRHYYDNVGDIVISQRHDWEKEKSMIDLYLKKGRIIHLKDLLNENTTCNDSE